METAEHRAGRATGADLPPIPDAARRGRPAPRPSPLTGRISPSAAALTRPLLVILPVVTFLIPALLLSFARQPVHTAEARILVGGFNVEAQAVPGFVEAARTLAATYARLVGTPAIVDPVSEVVDQPPGEVDGHISATSVPESSIIEVRGTGASERDAIAYADAAAQALLEYAGGTATGEAAADLLDEYRAAATEAASAAAEAARIDRVVGATAAPGAALLEQQATARATADATKLRADGMSQRYTELQSGGGTGQLSLVAPAAYEGTDRRSKLQLVIAASIGLGLVAGIALATFVVNQQASNRGAKGTALPGT